MLFNSSDEESVDSPHYSDFEGGNQEQDEVWSFCADTNRSNPMLTERCPHLEVYGAVTSSSSDDTVQ